jgi:hypothetical protein
MNTMGIVFFVLLVIFMAGSLLACKYDYSEE